MLKALLQCSLVGSFTAILAGVGRHKTALSCATVFAGNLTFRSRGNSAHSSGSFRPLGVLAPGAMGQDPARYWEWAFGLVAKIKRRVTGI
jgi:hypothetical protein